MVRLEVLDSSNFQRRSCDLKARNLPRYATSARSRSFSARAASRITPLRAHPGGWTEDDHAASGAAPVLTITSVDDGPVGNGCR